MDKIIAYGGNILALSGCFVCLLAVVGRLSGAYVMFGLQSVTIFIGGVALVILACLFKVEQILRLVRK
jgi:hypothetical protein